MMFEVLQTVLTVALSAIVGGQLAVTRTSRLRRTIDATISLRDRFPADDPTRAKLEAHAQELAEVLIRRQRPRFGAFTEAGMRFGALVGFAALALVFAGFAALLAVEVLPSQADSDPPTSTDYWSAAAFFLTFAGVCGSFAAWSARRQLREHPPSAQPSTEAGLAPD